MSTASKNRTKRVIEQLGMPPGTASAKLRKSILFNLLQKLKQDICIRCGNKIVTIDDLSIEHIKPWENIDPKLFWDLNNIAFSHLACNTRHVFKGGTGQRKIGPQGTSWCTGCQEFLPTKDFYKASLRWTGLSNNCKKCHDLLQGHGIKFGRHSEKYLSKEAI